MKNSNAKAAFLELLDDLDVRIKLRAIQDARYQREVFAGTVLPALVDKYEPHTAAEWAVEYADALIEELGRHE